MSGVPEREPKELSSRGRTRCANHGLMPSPEATEEAIVNAMLAADTMTGADCWRYYAIPHAELKCVLKKHGRLVETH